jgi:putative copper export protein
MTVLSITSLEAPLRALLFLALIWLFGLALSAELLLRPLLSAEQFARLNGDLRRRFIGAAGALAIAAIGLFAVVVVPLADAVDLSAPGEQSALLFDAAFGQMALARLALAALALVLTLGLRGRALHFALLAIGAIGALTVTRIGHSAAMDAGAQALASAYAHLLAGGIWAGGLTALVIASDALEGDANAPALVRSMIVRFSPLGMAAVGLSAATGALLSGTHMYTLAAFTETYFGRVLVAKVAVVAVSIALAGWHKLRAARGMRSLQDLEAFRRTLWIELLLVHVVFYAAALMTSAAAPGMPHGEASGALAGLSLKRWTELLAAAVALAVLFGALVERRARTPSASNAKPRRA